MQGLPPVSDPRLLTASGVNEDAAVVRLPDGRGLVQTVDFFTPIVNDPFKFGRIAAVNALSDVYAMGGTPLSAMNIVCFPIKTMEREVLAEILRGGLDAVLEAGAVPAGGHSVEDPEVKYGLAVSGLVDADAFATNTGLAEGDVLILTKPLGTGVLATALKGDFGDPVALENELFTWAGRLNTAGGRVIRELSLKAATDVTGFGLGGHLLEMAVASGVAVEIRLADVPFLPQAVELAGLGMLPAGSFANRNYCAKTVSVASGLDPIQSDLVFDAQTSGGLVLAVPEAKVAAARRMLLDAGDLAAVVGRVVAARPDMARLRIV
ncbi:selenide, water dikinase [Solidesulfovibrio fructosivorans JJ]]|uniref:Selenide, water dikinase n=1 Tax=Solidesulfovibrio fructosivorans JJ] TaxID=596151 RepID=E1JRH7_SOLFR|nr:selenide, water dikinase [Solidesulfovibrio fructosivorans JJ]]